LFPALRVVKGLKEMLVMNAYSFLAADKLLSFPAFTKLAETSEEMGHLQKGLKSIRDVLPNPVAHPVQEGKRVINRAIGSKEPGPVSTTLGKAMAAVPRMAAGGIESVLRNATLGKSYARALNPEGGANTEVLRRQGHPLPQMGHISGLTGAHVLGGLGGLYGLMSRGDVNEEDDDLLHRIGRGLSLGAQGAIAGGIGGHLINKLHVQPNVRLDEINRARAAQGKVQFGDIAKRYPNPQGVVPPPVTGVEG
jgi:hypothetical protein